MNHDSTALRELEQRYERLLLSIGDIQAAIGRLQQVAINPPASQPGGGGNGSVYWAQAPSAIAAATGSWPTLTPTSFTSDIYCEVGGTLTLQAASQTVYWFYKDIAAISSLIPVEPSAGGGGAWDAIGNSCTAV